MKIYKLKFTPVGPINKVPDSQTFFGALCNVIKDTSGSDILEELLKPMEKKDYPFIVSSFFLENTFPIPLDINPDLIDLNEVDSKTISTLKKLKKVDSISIGVFKDYLKDYETFNKEYYSKFINKEYLYVHHNNLVIKNTEAQEYFNDKICTTIIRTRNKINYEEDTGIFYNSVTYYEQKVKFDCYIKVKDDDIFQLIIKSLKSLVYLPVGGKRSIGMNLYKLEGYDEFLPIDLKGKRFLLSKCIIDNDDVDFNKSYYKIFTLNNKFDNNGKRIYKHNIVVLQEGSILKTNQEIVGSVINEEGENFTVYHNAVGFLL